MNTGESATMTLGALLQQGGVTMWPIYACSVLVVAVTLRKLWELKRAQLNDLGWIEPSLGVLERGGGDASEQLASTSHPGARVFTAAMNALREKPEHVESEAKRVGSLELQKLNRHLSVLSFLAQVAPLLGLLGTVLGMVDLFMGLQGNGQGTVSVGALSSGIWKALLTTAAGLTVAVPALAAHSYLTGRTDAVRLQFADLIQRIKYAVPSSRKAGPAHGV